NKGGNAPVAADVGTRLVVVDQCALAERTRLVRRDVERAQRLLGPRLARIRSHGERSPGVADQQRLAAFVERLEAQVVIGATVGEEKTPAVIHVVEKV